MRTPGSMLIVAAGVIGIIAACKKLDTPPRKPPPVSINVIHAMPKGKSIISMFGADTSGRYFAKGIKLNYGAAQLYSQVSGQTPLLIAATTDTTRALYTGTLDLESNGIYSLFLAGDTTKPDALFVKDDVPVYKDSSAGLRFANMARGGKSLAFSLATDSAHPVSSLGYLHVGEFIKYPANSTVPGGNYRFVIRDGATGDSLTTYTWKYTFFANNTILITGSTNPADGTPIKIFSTNNY